ncbi:DUF802 domain-containing protein [Lysobacter sp. BMK333-48F3]|uniref:DUF802 domain-containing protein n=1 Tax=Lysobacter sp. BMK333-48F3 TaxID=2867962 RepID=UPI001C8C6012|nr:DUF802 domain-containing protein [Lysobacter sp. BMK333-48F3]MBX9400557.1 DUF802 domain-containing protein [Lysobacter sp. BMK333-48F3]
MSKHPLHAFVFLAGLAAIVWVAAGYVGSHPLALSVAVLIGACYCAGAFELHRYRQATGSLRSALDGLSAPPPALGEWLQALDPSLRQAVRLRVEGERVALPAPGLTPYLVGLLVLLGMLGTLLGMMTTLRGTGLALESAADLQAVRDSIAAPVAGLGFAFGTSIAGVAASAILGLLSALCRRERNQAVQGLDAAIATDLRGYSQAQRREESFKLLQRQAEAMPTLIERMQAMMTALEQHSQVAHERQTAAQQAFHERTEAAYARLASSVQDSLRDSIGDSVRASGAALQPMVDATMGAIAEQTRALHASVESAVQRQADGLAAGFAATASTVSGIWNGALADQGRAHEALVRDLRQSLDGVAETFGRGATDLLDNLSSRMQADAQRTEQAWSDALARQSAAHEELAASNREALSAATAGFQVQAAALVRGADDSHAQLQASLAARDEQRLALWSERFEALSGALDQRWQQAGEQVAERQQRICDALARTAEDIAAQAQTHAEGTLAEVARLVDAAAQAPKAAAELLHAAQTSHAELQATLESRDEQRLAAWTGAFEGMAANLGQRWEQAGEQASERQQAICDTLARTADEIAAQAQGHARDTIAEISRLVDAAAEAPKAAAEVVAELRQKLSDSMVRDTAMLEERNRLLATLETLLDAVDHASTEQRAAVDALLAASSQALEQVGSRFSERVEAETGKLGGLAAQVSVGAAEVASLGEAFGAAVQAFGESSEQLSERLLGVENALEKSLSRSDEQLGYYVAQAREVIDLSVLSQKQIIENLQQLAERRAGAEAA